MCDVINSDGDESLVAGGGRSVGVELRPPAQSSGRPEVQDWDALHRTHGRRIRHRSVWSWEIFFKNVFLKRSSI